MDIFHLLTGRFIAPLSFSIFALFYISAVKHNEYRESFCLSRDSFCPAQY